MTNVVINVLDPKSIENAIGKMEDWITGKLKPASTEFAEHMANGVVRNAMAERAHVETGDLKRAIQTASVRRLDGKASMDIVAFHEARPEAHYASAEVSRGGTHDFTEVSSVAKKAAQAEWNASVGGKL